MWMTVGPDMRKTRSRFAALLCALSAGTLLATEGGSASSVILDQTCPLRRYYRFGEDLISPDAMISAGQGTLGDVLYARTAKATQKSLAVCGNDPFAVFRPSLLVLKEARKVGTVEALRQANDLKREGVDWRECVCRRMFYDPYTAPPPAADWAAASFDDSSWVDGPGPFQVDMPDDLPAKATEGSMATIHVGVLQFLGAGMQACYYRARFVVDDPAKAGELTFRATYRGGVRVLVNGQEIARGHLPEGELAADAAGDDYPLEAYTNASLRDRVIGPVKIPASLLRKGTNVLAIEIRASLLHPVVLETELSKSWNSLHDHEGLWRHCFLGTFSLTRATGAASSARVRPGGLQVWVADMHRRVSSDDFLPPGEPTGTLRLVGPQNGTCGGQLVVGSEKDVTVVNVSVSDLKAPNGKNTIPQSAATILHMLPYPVKGFTQALGDERGLGGSFPTQMELAQYGKINKADGPFLFDQITVRPQGLRGHDPADLDLVAHPGGRPGRTLHGNDPDAGGRSARQVGAGGGRGDWLAAARPQGLPDVCRLRGKPLRRRQAVWSGAVVGRALPVAGGEFRPVEPGRQSLAERAGAAQYRSSATRTTR